MFASVSVLRLGADRAGRGLLHLEQELGVGRRGTQPGQQQLHRLLLVHPRQQSAQFPQNLQLFLIDQQFLSPGARGVDVHGGEDAFVGQLAAEAQLQIPGALELLEDDLIHLRTGLYQGGRQDGQRTSVFDVARRTEELLRRVQRRSVHPTGQDPTGGGRSQVVGAREAGEGVQEYDDVLTQLHQPLGPLDGKFGHHGVIGSRAVEGGGDNLTLDRTLHIGDFLGPLIDERKSTRLNSSHVATSYAVFCLKKKKNIRRYI